MKLLCYAASVRQSPETFRLGPLEMQLMRSLWKCGNATVRELLESGASEGAYTTVLTTLDRLHKKGLLARTAEGRAFRYSPVLTETEFNGSKVRNAIRNF